MNGIDILHQNIRSLRANFDKFLATLTVLEYWPDVIALSEIWVYEGETKLYDIAGYCGHFHCNAENRSGGVAVYFKNKLNANRRQMTLNTVDAVQCTFRTKNQNVTLITLYRSPSCSVSEFNREFGEYLRTISCKNVVVMGDININLLIQLVH